MSVPRRTTTSRLEAGTIETGGAWTTGIDVPFSESPISTHAPATAFANGNNGIATSSTPERNVAESNAVRKLGSSNTYEIINDPEGAPALDFKPIMLKKAVLVVVAIFYITVIVAVSLLLFYEDRARVFHVEATASVFMIRFLPPLIGTLTTVIYTAIVYTYARILPYMEMAGTDYTGPKTANARKSMLAMYFPEINIRHVFQNRHWLLGVMLYCDVWVAPGIIPLKSSLLIRTPSADGAAWKITVYAYAARAIIPLYCLLAVTTLLLLYQMWDRRTGLKWDIVAIADYCVLFHQSNVLDDYNRWQAPPTSKSVEAIFLHLFRHHTYRLGYWKIRETGRIWYGVRRVNEATASATVNHDAYRAQTIKLLDDSRGAYLYVLMRLHSFVACFLWLLALALSIAAGYLLISNRHSIGYEISANNIVSIIVVTRAVPPFVVGLFNLYWNGVDIYYRLIQPFMGLRDPAAAKENFLLEYSTALPGISTITALKAKHWRLALCTSLAMANRLLVIFVSSLIIVESSTKSTDGVHLSFSKGSYYACAAMLVAYIFLIPCVFPGPARWLPYLPTNIMQLLAFFYASELTSDDAFRPRSPSEERRHVINRLQLQEKLYAYGVYFGRDGLPHLGIDNAYKNRARKVARLLPPPWWLYWNWTKQIHDRFRKAPVPVQIDHEMNELYKELRGPGSDAHDTPREDTELDDLQPVNTTTERSPDDNELQRVLSNSSERAYFARLGLQSDPVSAEVQSPPLYADFPISSDIGTPFELDLGDLSRYMSDEPATLRDQDTAPLLAGRAAKPSTLSQNHARRSKTN